MYIREGNNNMAPAADTITGRQQAVCKKQQCTG